eukprot:jgi/Tetstr1/437301/TSEL_002785.t1
MWKAQALKYHQKPAPSPLQTEFITASHRYSATRRRLLTVSALVMALLIVVGAVCSSVMAVSAGRHATRADRKTVVAEEQRILAEEQKMNAEREAAKALLESDRSKLLSRRTAASSLLSAIGAQTGVWAEEDVNLMNMVLSNFTGERMEAVEAAAATKLLDLTKLYFIARGMLNYGQAHAPHTLSWNSNTSRVITISNTALTSLKPDGSKAPLLAQFKAGAGADVTTAAITKSQSMLALAIESSVVVMNTVSLVDPLEVAVLRHSGAAVTALAWAPDGNLLAVGSADNLVRLWQYRADSRSFDADPAAVLPRLSSSITCLTFSDPLMMLAIGTVDGVVATQQVRLEGNGTLLAAPTNFGTGSFFCGIGAITALAFSPRTVSSSDSGQDFLAVAGEDGRVKLNSVRWLDNSVFFKFLTVVAAGHTGPATALMWSPDGSRLATGGADGSVLVWATKIGFNLPEVVLNVGDACITSLAWFRDAQLGEQLLAGTANGQLHAWVAGRESLPLREVPVVQGALSEQRKVAAVDFTAPGFAWSLFLGGAIESPAMRASPGAPDAAPPAPVSVNAVAWSPDGSLLAVAEEDGRVAIISTADVAAGMDPSKLPPSGPVPPLVTLSAHNSAVTALAWWPRGQLLASGGADGTLAVLDPQANATTVPPLVLQGHSGGVVSVDWWPISEVRGGSLTSHVLASAAAGGLARVWRLQYNTVTRAFSVEEGVELQEEGKVSAVAYTPSGSELLCGRDDGAIHMWGVDPQTGMLARDAGPKEMLLHAGAAPVASFSFAAGLMASVSATNAVQLWNMAEGEGHARLLQVLDNFSFNTPGSDVALSPDGRSLVAAKDGNQLIVWQLNGSHMVESYAEWSVQLQEGRQRGRLSSLSWSPDGTLLAVGARDGGGALATPLPSFPNLCSLFFRILLPGSHGLTGAEVLKHRLPRELMWEGNAPHDHNAGVAPEEWALPSVPPTETINEMCLSGRQEVGQHCDAECDCVASAVCLQEVCRRPIRYLGCFEDNPNYRLADALLREVDLGKCAMAATAVNVTLFSVQAPISKDTMQCWYPSDPAYEATMAARMEPLEMVMPEEQCIGSWDEPSYFGQQMQFNGGLFRAAVYTFDDL